MGKHPAYGYRRIKVELEVRHGVVVNHKRLRRVLLEWDLALRRKVARPRRDRSPTVISFSLRPSGVRVILKEAKGELNLLRDREPKPLQVLCTDFTEIRYAGGTKKAHLMAMIDPGSGWVPSFAVGMSADRELALRCWEVAKESLVKVGRDPQGLIVHQDQDTVYSSYDWLRTLLIEDGVVVYSGARSEGQPVDGIVLGALQGGERLPASRGSHFGGALVGGRKADGYAGYERRHSSLDYRWNT